MEAPDVTAKISWMEKLTDSVDMLFYLSHMKVIRVLGAGGFGVVREVQNTLLGIKVAVKEIDVHSAKARHDAEHEIAVLENIARTVEHPNIVKIHRIFMTSNSISMAMQYCSGGELYDRIVEQKHFSERDAALVMRQLMSALKALHDNGILHLDLKPENLIYANRRADSPVVLTDFGLSKVLTADEEEGSTVSGTVGYTAPEVITNKLYSAAADVFSAGVLLFIMLAGYPPFRSTDDKRTLTRTVQGHYEMPEKYWSGVSEEAKNLVRRMLMVRISARIKVDEVLSHPWLTREAPATPLDPTRRERLDRYNTERKTTTMMSALNRTVPNIHGAGKGESSAEARQRGFVLTEQQVTRMRETFRALGDADARIGFNTWSLLMRRLGAIGSRPLLRLMFDKMDTDKTGLISVDQHLAVTMKDVSMMSDDFLRIIFAFFSGMAPKPGYRMSLDNLDIPDELLEGDTAPDGVQGEQGQEQGQGEPDGGNVERHGSAASGTSSDDYFDDMCAIDGSYGVGFVTMEHVTCMRLAATASDSPAVDSSSTYSRPVSSVDTDVTAEGGSGSARSEPLRQGGMSGAGGHDTSASAISSTASANGSGGTATGSNRRRSVEAEVMDDGLRMTQDTISRALIYLASTPDRRKLDVTRPGLAADVFAMLSPDGEPLSFTTYQTRMWQAPELLLAFFSLNFAEYLSSEGRQPIEDMARGVASDMRRASSRSPSRASVRGEADDSSDWDAASSARRSVGGEDEVVGRVGNSS